MGTWEDVKSAVERALRQLIHGDPYLLENDANERTISHRFAMYLQIEIDAWQEGWNVDCEYNRDASVGRDYYPKKLDLREMETLKVGVDDDNATTVFPDVIVHKRGRKGAQGGNLLVIEMKKSSSSDNGEFDKTRKLPRYCDELGYQFGLFIMLYTRGRADYRLEWIRR